MQFDATGASLPDLFRSLNVDPEEKAALIRLAETVRRLEHEREYQAMLFGEPPPPPPPPPPSPRRRTPPEKRWLKAVPGVAPPLAAVGAFVRGHVRHAIAATAGAVVLAGGTLAPDLMHPAGVPPVSAATMHYGPSAHHRYPGRAPEELPAVVPVKRKRRRLDNDGTVTHPSPSPSAAPDPSPSPTVPDPLPWVTVPPVPTPDPTCTVLHGNHCHGGDVVGDVVNVLGALRGLRGAL